MALTREDYLNEIKRLEAEIKDQEEKKVSLQSQVGEYRNLAIKWRNQAGNRPDGSCQGGKKTKASCENDKREKYATALKHDENADALEVQIKNIDSVIIPVLDENLKIARQNLKELELTEQEVQRIIAEQGKTMESLRLQAELEGEAKIKQAEIVAQAEAEATLKKAEAEAEKAKVDASNKKKIGLAIAGAGAIVVLIVGFILIKKLKKKK